MLGYIIKPIPLRVITEFLNFLNFQSLLTTRYMSWWSRGNPSARGFDELTERSEVNLNKQKIFYSRSDRQP